MPPEVNGPKPKMKKSTIWILVGGGAVGLLGILYFYKKNSSSSSTASQDALAQQGIDPSTGIPYAEEYGSGLAGASGLTPSLYGYTGPEGSTVYPGVSGQIVTAPSTNAGWAQEVEAYLQNLGYDPTTVAAALGKYLTGGRVTQDQQSIIQAALGFFGNPPTAVPPINVSGGGGTGQITPPGTQPPKWIVPPVTVPPQDKLPVLNNPTQAQILKAFAKGRKASERGLLYIKGKWYRLANY